MDWGRLARGCARGGCGVPPLGAAALLWVCGAAASPAGLRPPIGWGGGERGGGGMGGRYGSPQSPAGPLAPPPSALRGPGPRAGPGSGPLPSSLSPRGAGWPGGGGGPARKIARCRLGGGLPRPHPPHPQPVGSGRAPAIRPNGREVGGGRAPVPGLSHTQARGAPPGQRHAALTARKTSSQERALWGW